jgi:septal ring factor EnvC (AmiA/AmiB activator)
MKDKINKDMDALKNNQCKISHLLSQINTSIKSLANKVEQVENRVSGAEDKVEELHQTVKDCKKMLRKYE